MTIQSKFVQIFEERLSTFAMTLLARERSTKRWLVLLLDMILCVAAVWIAMALRIGVGEIVTLGNIKLAVTALLLFPPIFYFSGTYRHIFRFVGGRTILQLAYAVALLTLPLVVIFMIAKVDGVPRTMALLFPMVFFLLLAISRICARHFLVDLTSSHGFTGQVKRAVIYGAGAAGQQLASLLRHEPDYLIVGFVDDDKRLHKQRVDGLSVFYTGLLTDLVDDRQIDTVFLALPNITRLRRRRIVESLSDMRVHVQTLPSMQEFVGGKLSIDDLREIQIDDLLGRDPVAPNELLLGRTIAGKTVMVTGAGGSIGSELCRQIARLHPKTLVLAEMTEHALYSIDRELNELKVAEGLDFEIVPELANLAINAVTRRMFSKLKPDTVFHAAAYKHVPLVEANVIGGMGNNVIATLNAAQAARANDVAHFVLISTDKAVRPTNVMGASKRVCELVLQALAAEPGKTRFAMVRFGNVLGSSGSVVPRFQQQIRDGGPVTLTHRDMTRFFMTIPEAAQLVIQAGAMANGGEVFLLDMGKPVKIYNLARSMIELAGLSVRDDNTPDGDIEIKDIGLRPGEKLYEELLINGNSEPTSHERIMRGNEEMIPLTDLMPVLNELRGHLRDGDASAALVLLRQLVPEYNADTALLGTRSA